MRVSLCLWPLLSLTLSLTLPPPPPPLLVLRAACSPPRPHLFDAARFRRYALTRGRLELSRNYFYLLPHKETCGPEWELTVSRAVLSALASGSGVAEAGGPGAALCAAELRAARVLRRAASAPCRAPRARAAAVAHLAARLQWRRALRPPALTDAGDPDCDTALDHIERDLLSSGVLVTSDPAHFRSVGVNPHVILFCESWEHGASERIHSFLQRAAVGAGVVHVVILTLQVKETPTNDDIVYKFPTVGNGISAPNLSVGNKPMDEKKDSRNVFRGHSRNFSDSMRDRNHSLSSYYNVKIASNVNVDSIFHGFDKTFLPLLFVQHNSEQTASEDDAIYDELLRAYDRDSEAVRTGIETSQMNFSLYQAIETSIGAYSWRHVVKLTTLLQRKLEEDLVKLSVERIGADHFTDWCLEHVVSDVPVSGEPGTGMGGGDNDRARAGEWSVVGGAAALAAATLALVVRRVGGRRRRAVRRAGVVLSLADITFPPDETRRVGDGVETALLWLQQLHEFGGPELERPDLLKRPPLATAPTSISSAPSSTCSVNKITQDRHTRYKGDAVHMKWLPAAGLGLAVGGAGCGAVGASLQLKRKSIDILLVMQSVRHENLNPFIGCVCEARPALVWEQCGRGSLEDVLMADDIKLDWTFRLSLLTDLVKGMRYLHASPLRLHGRLSSRNCVVDSRWVLRVTDYGVPLVLGAQGLLSRQRTPRELLWTAPELLRAGSAGGVGGAGSGSQAGDVFSFAIIMQEVIVRGEPYCMLALTPEEIIEKLCRPPPLIRPSVSMGAAPPEAVNVMRQCWSEAPDLRPDFNRLHDIFRHLHHGRKINIVDSMFEMLEKYSNNLEELIKDRTEQLDMEKKKTEQLLNRMLPRSVAERLLLGSRVEPEEFEDVSVYFSDIVGFTSLAARSTPVQVVDLLNELYTTFDAAIEQYRVYKVETIGDAYMVVGGLPVRARDHAESVATMALHLLHLAGQFRIRHLPGTPLHLRSGLHSGACCAGVVGRTMPRYCLFGDTVNTASRMESTGAAWRIQVSTATADRLPAAYRLRSRGLTQIKGKGAMHTYWLLGKDGFDKPLPTPPQLESEEVLFETDGENDSVTSVASTATMSSSKVIEHQQSEPSPLQEKIYAWQRSGAVSADSSPPRARPAPPVPAQSTHSSLAAERDHSARYARYKCLVGGAPRVLRRQWSLERGDALALAAGASVGVAAGAGADVELAAAPVTLDLAVTTAATVATVVEPLPRYRTRSSLASQLSMSAATLLADSQRPP